jgi:hypothetical protein
MRACAAASKSLRYISSKILTWRSSWLMLAVSSLKRDTMRARDIEHLARHHDAIAWRPPRK